MCRPQTTASDPKQTKPITWSGYARLSKTYRSSPGLDDVKQRQDRKIVTDTGYPKRAKN